MYDFLAPVRFPLRPGLTSRGPDTTHVPALARWRSVVGRVFANLDNQVGEDIKTRKNDRFLRRLPLYPIGAQRRPRLSVPQRRAS
jgi:hypothetical protein